jgi:NADP-dependent 3-hydroxy acid dehydrogenase YdfG
MVDAVGGMRMANRIDLANQTAVVTGAAQGIGRAAAFSRIRYSLTAPVIAET